MKPKSKKLINIVKVTLDILWYLNLIAFFIFILGMPVLLYLIPKIPAEFPVNYLTEPKATPLTTLQAGDVHAVLHTNGGMFAIELNKTFLNIATVYFCPFALSILSLIIIYQLRKFFISLKQNEPFTEKNIRRLKITALCCMLFTVEHIFSQTVLNIFLNSHIKEHYKFSIPWQDFLTGLIIGIIVYIFADVLRYGFELKKENEEFV